MITKTDVYKSYIGDKKGWSFSVSYRDDGLSGILSAVYKTKKEATQKLQDYIETGKLDTYGSAEQITLS